MLGLILGGIVGVGSVVVTAPLLIATLPVGFFMLLIPPLFFTTAPFDAVFMFSPLLLPPVIGGVLGFLAQLLGPDAVVNMCSGTMGAGVVCMDSCLDCVSVMTGGVLGPCLGMVGGAGAAMPTGGEAAAGGGLMETCMEMCGGMSPMG